MAHTVYSRRKWTMTEFEIELEMKNDIDIDIDIDIKYNCFNTRLEMDND